MSETASTMIPLGTIAPSFKLLDTLLNKMVSLEDFQLNDALVIMFICNHCPYVKHILPKLIDVANEYKKKGVQFIAISANDAETYPSDGPIAMRNVALEHHFPFPYLYDESQSVAKAYKAACTPDFFIFDRHLACVYRGRFDAATPGNHLPVDGADLCQALDHLLANKPINPNQKPSLGCNIKWK